MTIGLDGGLRSVTIRSIALLLLLASACASHGAPVNASEPATVRPAARQRIESADQLPRHSYPISTTATALFQDDKQFAALAQQVATDLRADLSKYDIQDHATLKRYYGILSNLALERADYKTAVAYQDSMRAVEDKPGLRLTTGIVERAMAAAAGAPGQPLETARFRNAFRGEIAALPYPEAQVAVAAMRSLLQLLTPNRALGMV